MLFGEPGVAGRASGSATRSRRSASATCSSSAASSRRSTPACVRARGSIGPAVRAARCSPAAAVARVPRERAASLGAAGQCDVAPTGALHASQRVSAECACPPRGDEGRRAPQERYWLPNAGPHAYAQRVCAAAHVRSQASAGGSAAHAGDPSPPLLLARTWAALPHLYLKPASTTTRAAVGPWPYPAAHLVQLDLRVHGRHVCIQRVRIRGRLGAAARGRRGAAGRPLPARGAARVVLCPVRGPGASPGNLGSGGLGIRQSRGRSLRRGVAPPGGWASGGNSCARDSRGGRLLAPQRARQRHALAQQRLLPRRRCGAQRARARAAQRARSSGARGVPRTPDAAGASSARDDGQVKAFLKKKLLTSSIVQATSSGLSAAARATLQQHR